MDQVMIIDWSGHDGYFTSRSVQPTTSSAYRRIGEPLYMSQSLDLAVQGYFPFSSQILAGKESNIRWWIKMVNNDFFVMSCEINRYQQIR